jgi:hypothetical protein
LQKKVRDALSPRITLRKASVQDIQLELIRRGCNDGFDGERLVRSLLAHRQLWVAAHMDRFCFSNPGKLPSVGLIKLRDLDGNFWNVDTLYVLTPDLKCAKQLARIAKTEGWGGLVLVHDDPVDVDRALGGGERGRAVVSVWWD